MSFQFNFNIDETSESPGECEVRQPKHAMLTEDKDTQSKHLSDLNESRQKSVTSDERSSCQPATEHQIPKDVSSVLENKIVEDSSGLKFVNVSVVEMTLSNTDVHSEDKVIKSIMSNSDLISGVYEGGMKIWECTFDLIRYFEDKDVNFEGKSVLDLGCGAGLLGIFSLKHKAKVVHFQDYNSTVIDEITIPNTLVNCDDDNFENNIDYEPTRKRSRKSHTETRLLSRCHFFSGEWSQFSQLMQNQVPPMKYDVILTSETLYNLAYYTALHDVFQNLLSNNGVVYIASKSHYFGVGGGVHLFETFINERKIFKIHTLKVTDDGLERMLLRLDFNDKS